MKNTMLAIALLFSFNMLSFGQETNWTFELGEVPLSELNPNFGQIVEFDNSFRVYKKEKFWEISYFGEIIKENNFNYNGTIGIGASLSQIFSRTIDGEEVIIVSWIRNSGRTVFDVFSPSWERLVPPFELEERVGEVNSNEVDNIMETPNGNLITFQDNIIYRLQLNADLSFAVINSVEHDFGTISSSLIVGDNFLITSKAGKAILLNSNFETIWETETDVTLMKARVEGDAYIIAGNDFENEVAYVYKADNNGSILEQFSYEGLIINDLLPMDNGVLIAGTKVFLIDAAGTEIELVEIPENDVIYRLKESQFGSVFLSGEQTIYSFDWDAKLGFFTSNRLGANNIGPKISPWGNLDASRAGGFNFPRGEETATIYANSPIFIGKKENEALTGIYDPYSLGEGLVGLPGNQPAVNHVVWKISQNEIDDIQKKLELGLDLAPYSQAMLTYPGIGNPNCIINEEVVEITEPLAPFIDVNGDGIYNMFDGDYPEMKGDQMIWWAMLDVSSQMSIQGRWYAYDCGDHSISNTVYAEYELINSSNENLTDCRFGLYNDMDLGCQVDDLLGSMPDVNSVFFYNSDEVDGEAGGANCGEIASFGTEIPVQSITFLDNEMDVAMYINTSPITELVTEGPHNLDEVMNFMTAKFNDGTPLTNGGNGYNSNGGAATNYAFPGNPADENDWALLGEAIAYGDFRSISGTTAFDLAVGAHKVFTFAYTTHPNIPHPAPNVSPVKETIIQVTNIYDNGNSFASVNLGEDLIISSGQVITLNPEVEGLSYQWSTGESSASIEVSAPGDYAVTVTDETGCQRTDDVTVGLMTGMEEVAVPVFSIAPNPVSKGSQVKIELPESNTVRKLSLFNILGQELYTELFQKSNDFIEFSIPSVLSSGAYLLELTFDDGAVATKKLIVE